MKLDVFLANQALAESDWPQLAAIIISHFNLSKIDFYLKKDIQNSSKATRAVLVLVDRRRSYAFISSEHPDTQMIAKSGFQSWEWDSPISSKENYLLVT